MKIAQSVSKGQVFLHQVQYILLPRKQKPDRSGNFHLHMALLRGLSYIYLSLITSFFIYCKLTIIKFLDIGMINSANFVLNEIKLHMTGFKKDHIPLNFFSINSRFLGKNEKCYSISEHEYDYQNIFNAHESK